MMKMKMMTGTHGTSGAGGSGGAGGSVGGGGAAGPGSGGSGSASPQRVFVTCSGHGLTTANLWRHGFWNGSPQGLVNNTVAFVGQKLHPGQPVPEKTWDPSAPRHDLLLPPTASDFHAVSPDPQGLATSYENVAIPHQRDLMLALRFDLGGKPWPKHPGLAPAANDRGPGGPGGLGGAGSAPPCPCCPPPLHAFWEHVRGFVRERIVRAWNVPAILVLHVPGLGGANPPALPHIHALVFARTLRRHGWDAFPLVTHPRKHPALIAAWRDWNSW